MTAPDPRQRLAKHVEQASELRIWLALAILLCLRFYRHHLEGHLHGLILPDRRQQSLPVYLAPCERRRPLHPIHLVMPVTAVQILIFLGAAFFQSEQAFFNAGILNLFVAAFAMLPSFRRNTIA